MVNPMGFFRFTVGNSWSDTPSLSNSIHNCYISKTKVGLAPHVKTTLHSIVHKKKDMHENRPIYRPRRN
jgi:hypothetical protein